MAQGMTIGQLAGAAGVNVETVRYYRRRELLAAPDRPSRGIGRYPPSSLTRLRFIKRSQSLGFSLEDVRALLLLDDGQACASAREIGEHKLADVRQRIQTLQALESALQKLVCECSASKKNVSCPLIEALMGADAPGAP
ncbi:MerR family transcriptional regulator [Piscinibacter koreensis]|uniref:Mercuric resistance operon regulatory protein n=1 Tax=Piscinibacter koreensis TaxID=2742824 RepID=A0A7Y6TZ89_9BURK|nr:MerR family DNA-binding protein [Schlegelella koreensis]NUZ08885.1 MerR family DNA-binding protein [Schlegelella koreensis]